MPLFDLEQFSDNGMLREESFRRQLDAHDWEQYRGKSVHIRGCGSMPVPTWAYLMTAAKLGTVARKITFGEEQAPLVVFQRPEP